MFFWGFVSRLEDTCFVKVVTHSDADKTYTDDVMLESLMDIFMLFGKGKFLANLWQSLGL